MIRALPRAHLKIQVIGHRAVKAALGGCGVRTGLLGDLF